MKALDDIGLLREYSNSGTEEAFETLVNRHIGFVYSAALRQVRDSHLAEEVTQTVFILLAQKAGTISDRAVLAGWLFNTTRLTALTQMRAAAKLWHREQEVQLASQLESDGAEPTWKQISPVLDEALCSLPEKDRHALLLRFFEGKSLKEVGETLALGEDGARKRTNRALEKLHRYFMRRGISSTTGLIAAALSANTVHAVPAALAKSVVTLAAAKGAAAGSSTLALTKGVLKLMIWSKTQTVAVGLVVAGLATMTVVQYHSQTGLQSQNQQLQQQLESLQSGYTELSNQLAQANSSLRQSNVAPSIELLQLRNEVGLLRRQTNELRASKTHSSAPSQAQPTALSEDYPKTPQAATQGIFDALSSGNLEKLFTDYGEPGVPKELYEKMFGDEKIKTALAGLKVLSIGEPTNSFGPDMWFVPYKIRFQDGNEKEMRLHIAQDPATKKWYFKGGL